MNAPTTDSPPEGPPPAQPALAPKYELFVVHAAGDHAFVHGYLLPAIGLPEERVLVTGELPLDATKLAGLEHELEVSRVFLVVLTPAFLADPWAQLAEQWATHVAVAAERQVIPLVLEECEIPLHLKANVQLDFSRSDEWEDEVQRLRKLFARPPPLEPVLPCPYPGMQPFQTADAAHFHGRDREIGELVEHLRAGARELYVVGPSGSGKSSLVYAGLLPRLETERQNERELAGAPAAGPTAVPAAGPTVVRTFRPGEAPVQRLARALGVDGEATGEALAAAVTAALAGTPGAERLLLVVDQLEELFALAPGAEQQRFAVAVAALRAEPRCALLFTLRADFFAELMQSPLWREAGITHVDVAPLRGAGLRAAIELPARAAGVHLEPALVERLLADAESPGALPLLQATLRLLWERRRRRLLPLAAYRSLGEGERSGFAVAISRHADDCLARLSAEQQRIARRVFLRLVSFGEGRLDTRRQQPVSALRGGEPPAELSAVLAALTAARLVSQDDGAITPGQGDRLEHNELESTNPELDRPEQLSGDDRVDLAHEALITAWSPLADWIKVRRADEEHRRQLELRSARWIARGRGAGGLLDPEELAAARAWRRSAAAAELGESPELAAFLDASEGHVHRERQRRARRIAGSVIALAAFTVIAIVLAAFARDQAREAGAQRTQVVRLLGNSYQETGRRFLLGGQAQRAVPYLVAAREQGLDGAGLRMMFRQATANPLLATMRHAGEIGAFTMSRDGSLLYTGGQDETVKIWELPSGRLRHTLRHAGAITDLALSDDEATLTAATRRGEVWSWDAQRGTLRAAPRRLLHDDEVQTWLSPGAHLAAAIVPMSGTNPRGGIFVWNLDSPQEQPFWLHRSEMVLAAGFSPDGERLWSATGAVVKIWDLESGEELVSSPGRYASFSSNSQVVISSLSSSQVWDLTTRIPGLDRPIDHEGFTFFTADSTGKLLVTAGQDGTARVWNILGNPVSSPLRHGSTVFSADFDHAGDHVATASADHTARLWEITTGLPVTGWLEHDEGVKWGQLTPDDRRLLTVSRSTARLWDATPQLRKLPASGGLVVVSPDGGRVLVTGEIWDPGSRQRVSKLARPDQAAIASAAFSAGGQRLVTRDWSDVTRAWDTATGQPLGPPIQTRSLLAVAISDDGRRIATGTGARVVQVWDAATGSPRFPPLFHFEGRSLRLLALSSDGQRLVTAADHGNALLWDLAAASISEQPVARPLAHGGAVSSVRFLPGGDRLLTTSYDGAARIWQTATGALLATFEHGAEVLCAQLGRDGSLLLTGGMDNQARLWDTASGKQLLALPHLDKVGDVALSSDGQLLATTAGGALRLWDRASGTMLLDVPNSELRIHNIQFSADDRHLLVEGGEELSELWMWDVATDSRSLAEWQALAAGGQFLLVDGQLVAREPAEGTK